MKAKHVTVTFSDMPTQRTEKTFDSLSDAKTWVKRQLPWNAAQWQELVKTGSISVLCAAWVKGQPDVTMTITLD